MESFHEYITEYKKQLADGTIPNAYKGLMEYIMSLRTYFSKKYPDYSVSGNIYYGYMDMTYFSFFPDSLKKRKLKAGIIFLHQSCKFEVWLFGYNKQIQSKYWELIKDSGWNKYHLVPTTKGNDSILEHVLTDNPDFSDLDAMTKQIEKGTLKFIKDVEEFLLKL
jgi:hypothetical protein